jgi:hypothetical protein
MITRKLETRVRIPSSSRTWIASATTEILRDRKAIGNYVRPLGDPTLGWLYKFDSRSNVTAAELAFSSDSLEPVLLFLKDVLRKFYD